MAACSESFSILHFQGHISLMRKLPGLFKSKLALFKKGRIVCEGLQFNPIEPESEVVCIQMILNQLQYD